MSNKLQEETSRKVFLKLFMFFLNCRLIIRLQPETIKLKPETRSLYQYIKTYVHCTMYKIVHVLFLFTIVQAAARYRATECVQSSDNDRHGYRTKQPQGAAYTEAGGEGKGRAAAGSIVQYTPRFVYLAVFGGAGPQAPATALQLPATIATSCWLPPPLSSPKLLRYSLSSYTLSKLNSLSLSSCFFPSTWKISQPFCTGSKRQLSFDFSYLLPWNVFIP